MKKSCSPSRTKSWIRWLQGRFTYAFAGLQDGVFKDRSIRFQFILGLMAILAGIVLGCSLQEWLWIALAITLVLCLEIINSCIEKTVDYISLERNEQAKAIKDMAAAAVMLGSLFALFVACLIFIPRVYIWIERWIL